MVWWNNLWFKFHTKLFKSLASLDPATSVPPPFLDVCSESHDESYYVPGISIIVNNIAIPTGGTFHKRKVCDKMIVVDNPAYKEYLNGRKDSGDTTDR